MATLKINELDRHAINVIVGYHLTGDTWIFSSYRVVFYQLEQLTAPQGWYTPERMEMLRQAPEIWDYSQANIDFLNARGVYDVKPLPIGFHENLRTIPALNHDIGILFYGLVNERREKILGQLQEICKVEIKSGLYGNERDALIARAKIVLNIHFYESHILEQCRISYLLNNGRFVVSEDSPHNPYEGMLVTAKYEDLPQVCAKYLRDEKARLEIAERGFAEFRKRPMTEYLRAVLSR